MGRPAVCVEGLSKRYRIGPREPYHRFSELLSGWACRALAAPRDWYRLRMGNAMGGSGQALPEDPEIWALQDVSFEVDEGQAIGIIGRNGAGKSTLLKILSRITEPTVGRFGLRGRVASLLEVGSGFHPELTGRDNIYLNGVLLGMTRPEVRNKFDEIVAFAEIGPFLDTPVKRYSSGMYTRLAFAVAAHLETDILIVDEVLAVGDAQFQRKCLGKMSEVARGGRTVLFVSHNMLAIEALCGQALLLERGRIAASGDSRFVTGKYLDRDGAEYRVRQWDDVGSAPGGSHVRLHRAAVTAPHSTDAGLIDVHTEIVVEFEYWNLVEGLVLNPSVVLYDQEGRAVFNTGPIDEPNWNGKPFPRGLFRSTFIIPADLLNDGNYDIQLYMIKDAYETVERFDGLLRFSVADDTSQRRGWHGKWPGAVRPKLVWDTSLLVRHELPETSGFVASR